jgi:hypothetical protein
MTRKLLPSLLAASLLALLAPAGAAAAPWTCESSGVRGTLGPAPAIEPVTANQDGARAGEQVATFRFRTRVRFRVANPRLFRTFTLPQYVDIG